jgi:RNA methyltransferase, TrmH family
VHDSSQPDITSTKNRWIKLARSLHRRRQRYRERAILVEGARPVAEVLQSDVTVHVLLFANTRESDEHFAPLIKDAHERGISVLSVEERVLATASDTETPQGILAICSMPESLPPEESPRTPPLVLIIDQVRDPGNLGTLLRSALGAGVTAVFISPTSADPYSPKVLRAGAGSHFRLHIEQIDWTRFPVYLEKCNIYAAEADASLDYAAIDWTQASAIVVGNETSGVSEAAFRRVHGRVGIPLANSLESLNAGVAGSVILFEAWRQRRSADKDLATR